VRLCQFPLLWRRDICYPLLFSDTFLHLCNPRKGNADFSKFTAGRVGRAEAMKKGTAYLNVWMEVVGHLEKAVADCGCSESSCKQQAVAHVDQAVAYYAGSLAGRDEDYADGVLLYALANKRALDFKTAGHMDDKGSGTAWVNMQIIEEFKKIQQAVMAGDQGECPGAVESKNRIVNLMKVPLIQGALRYAYIQDKERSADNEGLESMQGEGATFAAAVLPQVHACGPSDAKRIFDNLRVGASKTNFDEVKHAFERHYECMGVTCSEVGGIWNGEEYLDHAGPCDGSEDDSVKSAGVTAGAILGVTVGALLVGWLFIRYRTYRTRKQKQILASANIAAVSEIA
jgi:hypothetical protein